MGDRIEPGTERVIDAEINKALFGRGVLLGSPVKENVRQRFQLVWGNRDAGIRVLGDDGRLQTIRDYLNDLEADPRYASNFSQPRLPRISAAVEASVRKNFTKIVTGEIEVVD